MSIFLTKLSVFSSFHENSNQNGNFNWWSASIDFEYKPKCNVQMIFLWKNLHQSIYVFSSIFIKSCRFSSFVAIFAFIVVRVPLNEINNVRQNWCGWSVDVDAFCTFLNNELVTAHHIQFQLSEFFFTENWIFFLWVTIKTYEKITNFKCDLYHCFRNDCRFDSASLSVSIDSYATHILLKFQQN